MKEGIIDEVIDDLDVQYHWSSIAVELDNDIAQLLLKEIVRLWLNIRGFSAASSLFVERFKQCQEKSTHAEGSWTQERFKEIRHGQS